MQCAEGTVGNRVFYINLDRVPERRAFMEDQFARTGLIGAQRICATDASVPGALESTGYVPGSGTRWGLTPSEIACFESHRTVWQHVVDSGLPAAAIFEDDVEMSVQAGSVIAELFLNTAAFDCVKLDYSPRSRRFGAQTHIGSVSVRPMMEMAPSAAAYVVSQSACRKLLEWSQSYSDHLDDFLTLPRNNWKLFQVFPAVGVQMIWSGSGGKVDEPVKESERTKDVRINSGLDKGPMWFRLRRELQAAGLKFYWRAGGQARLLRHGGYVGFVPCADDLKV
ncbi:putative glycosyl transferase [Ruegeria lacuscaerulensis ITI-1157]|nr:putative glycosyl transferase [Ruegeria lacuscaerulensis ITI-1157]SHI63153.1 Glycosyltransferase involved in LPS biosynthesis, GR25 family [Ruegeria lacuscaerulensis ITI-1157]